MSRTVRTWFLSGCVVIAALEARRAGDSLSAGLSGPYAGDPPAEELRATLPADVAPSQVPPILLLGPAQAPIAGWLGRGGR